MKNIFVIIQQESDNHAHPLNAYTSEEDAQQMKEYLEHQEQQASERETWHLPVYFRIEKITLID